MQKLLVEVSHEDQIFVENECTNKGHTISSFFKLILDQYKNGGENSLSQLTKRVRDKMDVEPEECEEVEKKPKRRGRTQREQS